MFELGLNILQGTTPKGKNGCHLDQVSMATYEH